MAERLGIGLQNQVQQFDSAWHLQKCLWSYPQGHFLYKIPPKSLLYN